MCEGNYNELCFDAPAGLTGYTKGNGDLALSTSVCTDAAISVGAYITRTNWTNYENGMYSYLPSKVTGEKQNLGEIADFSSNGVDDNGKAHPMVIAPGMGII